MNWWLALVPFIGALTGWLLNRMAVSLLFYPLHPVRFAGLTFHGMLYKRQHDLSGKIGKLVGEELFTFKDVEQKIINEDNLDRIMPAIETHIDHFLQVKLKEAMPVVAMFVGDKTISQLKMVFMAELQTLFPLIMKNYLAVLENELDLEKMVAAKLAGIPPEKIKSALQPVIRPELRFMEMTGALTGFVTGVILLLCILIFF